MSDDQLAELRRILGVTYTPAGVDIWLEAPNRHLGGWTPLQLIADGGRMDDVIAAAQRIEGSI